MLLKFKHMKTRKAIQEQLMTKFDLIMQQFSKEVSNIEHIFTVWHLLILSVVSYFSRIH